MKRFAIELLTLAVLTAPAPMLWADDDDDDDRRSRWRRVEPEYWNAPRVYPPPYDGWRQPRPVYPAPHPYPPPTWQSPWEVEPWRQGYWEWRPYPRYDYRPAPPRRWRGGDDDDDDDD
jgi:hypothetical protein